MELEDEIVERPNIIVAPRAYFLFVITIGTEPDVDVFVAKILRSAANIADFNVAAAD